MRPQIVGEALNQVAADPDVETAMFEILEIQKIIESKARITLLPANSGILPELMATASGPFAAASPPPFQKKGAGAT